MMCIPRVGQGRGRCAAAPLAFILVSVALVVLLPLALGACGAAATDQNEPNDELNDAHALTAGESADGVIGSADDSDVFSNEAPAGGTARPFVVTVRTETPQDLELQVGASIPGVWEGITWPGWEAVTLDDRIELAGELRKGTVLMFLKGSAGTEYAVDIVWK